MKLKAIPLSRAKTAWGHLQHVKRIILAEPKRVDMGTFKGTKLPTVGGPACGTVACFAGWTLITAGKNATRTEFRANRLSFSTPATRAQNLLGKSLDYSVEGGTDEESYEYESVFNSGNGDACERTRPGTVKHARAVVARINRFMARNAAALKAKQMNFPWVK